MSLKKIIFSTNPISIDIGILIARVVLGIYFIVHSYELFDAGAMKSFAGYLSDNLHFPKPLLMAYLRTSAEFFGGIMLILGIFTRIAAILILFVMIVAAFTAGNGDLFGDAELNVIYASFCLTILLLGTGKFSIQKLIENEG